MRNDKYAYPYPYPYPNELRTNNASGKPAAARTFAVAASVSMNLKFQILVFLMFATVLAHPKEVLSYDQVLVAQNFTSDIGSISSTSTTSGSPESFAKIVTKKNTSLCLGMDLHVVSCEGNANRKESPSPASSSSSSSIAYLWHVDKSNGFIRSALNPNKCIQAESSSSIKSEDEVVMVLELEDCVAGVYVDAYAHAPHQQWDILSNGRIQLRSEKGKCIGFDGAENFANTDADAKADNGRVYLQDCDSSLGQYWTLVLQQADDNNIPSIFTHTSTSNSITTARRKLDESSDSDPCAKTAEEISLERLLENLDDQLLDAQSLVNDTETAYALSREVYCEKDSLANETFDALLLAEQDVELKGKNLIHKLKAFINSHREINFFDDIYNSTVDDFDATTEVLLAQTETYIQSLEDGDILVAEEVERGLKETFLSLNNIIGYLSAYHSGWEDGLDSAHEHLEQASQLLDQYSNIIAALDMISDTDSLKLLELSAAKAAMKMKKVEAESARDSASEICQQWDDTVDALEILRNATHQKCLAYMNVSSSVSSPSSSRRFLSRRESIRRRTESVESLETQIETTKANLAQLEADKMLLEDAITAANQAEDVAEEKYTEARKKVKSAREEEKPFLRTLKVAKILYTIARNDLKVASENVCPSKVLSSVVEGILVAEAMKHVDERSEILFKRFSELREAKLGLQSKQKEKTAIEEARDEAMKDWDAKKQHVKDNEKLLDNLKEEIDNLHRELKELTSQLQEARSQCRKHEIESSETENLNISDPGGHDDPHLYTWKGVKYDYHGECDLIYTTCPKFDFNKGLHVHLRTEFVMPRQWSTISSIAVKVGEDVLEVQNNGTYYHNREMNADLTGTKSLSGHEISLKNIDVLKHIKLSIFRIELSDGIDIEITRSRNYGRDGVSFRIHGVHEHRENGGDSFHDCQGLSSSWDHPDSRGFLIGRSGKSYSPRDAIDFGPEWQVDLVKEDPMLFVENIGHHLPDQRCSDSPIQAKDQRHLEELVAADGGALARQAEEVCNHVNNDALFDSCFFDVLVTGDVTFAGEHWYTGGK